MQRTRTDGRTPGGPRPKRSSEPLGGEFRPPGRQSTYKARVKFMSAVRTCAPEALDELAALAAEERTPSNRIRVKQWIERWRFNTDRWLVKITFQKVANWRHYPQHRELRFGGGPYLLDYPELFEKTTTRLPPVWRPRIHSRRRYLELVDHYMSAVEAAELSSGAVLTDIIRSSKHFEWLVLYHVCGMTSEEIASQEHREDDFDSTTIPKAVRKTALLIDLTLRP